MENITAITVNWLTTRRTLGAVNSFRKYYPQMPLLIIDDGSDPRDKDDFFRVYRGDAEVIYDPDNNKLKQYPDSEYIQVPTHRRHGESIDYALPSIKTKWIFHFDSDVRFIKPGVIENMFTGVNDNVCGIGISKTQKHGYEKIANMVAVFRADLAKQYKDEGATFSPIYELGLEAGTRYFKVLTDKDYRIKFCDVTGYYKHLRYNGGNDDWTRYF